MAVFCSPGFAIFVPMMVMFWGQESCCLLPFCKIPSQPPAPMPAAVFIRYSGIGDGKRSATSSSVVLVHAAVLDLTFSCMPPRKGYKAVGMQALNFPNVKLVRHESTSIEPSRTV